VRGGVDRAKQDGRPRWLAGVVAEVALTGMGAGDGSHCGQRVCPIPWGRTGTSVTGGCVWTARWWWLWALRCRLSDGFCPYGPGITETRRPARKRCWRVRGLPGPEGRMGTAGRRSGRRSVGAGRRTEHEGDAHYPTVRLAGPRGHSPPRPGPPRAPVQLHRRAGLFAGHLDRPGHAGPAPSGRPCGRRSSGVPRTPP
jgi:hypothetical protein